MSSARWAKDWRTLANAAMAALTEDSEYRTTMPERVALVCMTIETVQTTRASLTLANIAGRCPLSRRRVQAVCSRHLDEINANLGTNFTYERSSYDASGRGAFGRSKGGSRARQHEARLVDRRNSS